MGPKMRERVNAVIRYGRADGIKPTDEYVDQAMVAERLNRERVLFASYTPWGIACIEAAFRDRMQDAEPWDSKDLIRRDILEDLHLAVGIKERLLKTFEETDWAGWHDSWFAKRIRSGELEGLGDAIRLCSCLAPRSRDNLLLNLKLAWGEVSDECSESLR